MNVIVLAVLAGVGSMVADNAAATGDMMATCQSDELVVMAMEVMYANRSDVFSRTSTRTERDARTPLPWVLPAVEYCVEESGEERSGCCCVS